MKRTTLKKAIKEYHKNPRVITEDQFELLKRDLEELGDLSGIVYDINSGETITGNQRSKVFDINNCKIEITKKYKKPTKTGTVAEGWIYYSGEKYSYREVKWTLGKCEKANVVANKAGGNWDFDILANQFDIKNLLNYGFEEWEFGIENEIKEKEIDENIETENECPKCGYKW